jgi:hypothetical protein
MIAARRSFGGSADARLAAGAVVVAVGIVSTITE